MGVEESAISYLAKRYPENGYVQGERLMPQEEIIEVGESGGVLMPKVPATEDEKIFSI
ncbi:hypothetical protein [Calothrix sp. PCC 6303]|uniref:hypothetical protein n=1 Tax=Calothrix sp. PCC 6303 TaxID=1170562 RepID=UPI0002A0542D|nr:hypothetical protein [Calothrix sp. PCC 6303]AFZ03787.1 hypothetical protein Cal6303_4889 [Calothrix sp. PCC 6303]